MPGRSFWTKWENPHTMQKGPGVCTMSRTALILIAAFLFGIGVGLVSFESIDFTLIDEIPSPEGVQKCIEIIARAFVLALAVASILASIVIGDAAFKRKDKSVEQSTAGTSTQ